MAGCLAALGVMPLPGKSHRVELRAVWPWLPLWAALALIAIFSHGPMALHSTRTLSVAWEMWTHGHWLVPHLNGAAYADKVPLLYWLIHAGWLVGGVGDVWPRLLAVLLGVSQLLLAWRLAARWLAPEAAASGHALIMMVAFAYPFLFAIQIMYDGLLAVWVLAAILCLVGKPGRAAPRFAWLALFLGLGLLSKGPVVLLHVLPVWLLGPLWSEAAAADRRRWYLRGSLAVLGGLALFALWLVPAMALGGGSYRHDLLYNQTAGRVVDAFDHAQPWWWYGPRLLVLLLPFAAWPRLWAALVCLRRPLPPAARFALCWLLPVLLGFSMISGKQMYYLIPEMAAFALLGVVALNQLRQHRPAWWHHGSLGPWPLALAWVLLAAGLAAIPWWVSRGASANIWLVELAPYSRWFAPLCLVLGVLCLRPGRDELRRIACSSLLGIGVLHALFTLAWWPRYDLAPAANLLSQTEAQGRAIAIIGLYEGQYHFLGRLQKPIERIQANALPTWARAHPHGVVITDPPTLPAGADRQALLVQSFRSRWVVLWRAEELAAAKRQASRDSK